MSAGWAQRWRQYFEDRHGLPLEASFDEPLPESEGKAIIGSSVATFELGESGDGEHLLKYAARRGDPDYLRAIELFVLEENAHAQWLGLLRERFGGERVTSHWSDAVFVVLRRRGSLRIELGVLLAAEVTALSYYRVLAQAYPDPALVATCQRVLLDERGHVAFHREMLRRELEKLSFPMRVVARLVWRALVFGAATVVALDHRGVLELAGQKKGTFVREVFARSRRFSASKGALPRQEAQSIT